MSDAEDKAKPDVVLMLEMLWFTAIVISDPWRIPTDRSDAETTARTSTSATARQ